MERGQALQGQQWRREEFKNHPPLGEEGVYIGTAKLTIASSKPKKKSL
jgi:hypothetical protein